MAPSGRLFSGDELHIELFGALSTDTARVRGTAPRSSPAPVPNRIVRIDGVPLYLGEDEKFAIPLPFWQTNFNEIISLLPASSFSSFTATAKLIEMF